MHRDVYKKNGDGLESSPKRFISKMHSPANNQKNQNTRRNPLITTLVREKQKGLICSKIFFKKCAIIKTQVPEK